MDSQGHICIQCSHMMENISCVHIIEVKYIFLFFLLLSINSINTMQDSKFEVTNNRILVSNRLIKVIS